jgi:hypothetical protein
VTCHYVTGRLRAKSSRTGTGLLFEFRALRAGPSFTKGNFLSDDGGRAAHNHQAEIPVDGTPAPALLLQRLAAMKLAPNFIRSFFARSESSPPTASGADVVPVDRHSNDGGDTLLSPSTYHDAHTGLTPSSLWGDEPTSPPPDHEDLGSAPPSDVDSPVEVASDSSSPPGARVLFQGLQGLDEDQAPAEADKVSLEGGEEEEEASNETLSDDSEEDPKAKSNDAADGDDLAAEPETKTSDDDAAEPETETSAEPETKTSDDDAAELELSASDDDAAELEAAAAGEAGHVASRSNDSVEIQEVDRPPLAPRTSSRLAAARARQMAADAAAAAAAERNRPFLQGAPVPDNRPRPEPDFEIGDWLYAEWPTNHVRFLSMRSIVFF